MKTLKKYKILQILIGVLAGFLVLAVSLLVTGLATWDKLPFDNLLSKIVLTIFPVMLTAGLTFLAVASKSNGLKLVYYPAFAINLGSLASAVFYYFIEDSIFRKLFSFAKTLGLPFGRFAAAVTEKLTYTVNYDGWSDKYSIIYEFDVLMIFLLGLLVSVAVYQLYRDNDKHYEKLSRWRLENPARSLAISSICFYGTFVADRMIWDLLDGVTYSVESLSIIYEIINVVFMVFWYASFLLTLSGMIIILPIGITIALSVLCIVKAIKTSNPRQLFNPLVLLAIILSILGSYMMYTFTMSGF